MMRTEEIFTYPEILDFLLSDHGKVSVQQCETDSRAERGQE